MIDLSGALYFHSLARHIFRGFDLNLFGNLEAVDNAMEKKYESITQDVDFFCDRLIFTKLIDALNHAKLLFKFEIILVYAQILFN